MFCHVKTARFQPSALCMLPNGRLYHPAPFADYALVRSALALELFPRFQFEGDTPRAFQWKGERVALSGQLLNLLKSTEDS